MASPGSTSKVKLLVCYSSVECAVVLYGLCFWSSDLR